jgi:hypothetical protein
MLWFAVIRSNWYKSYSYFLLFLQQFLQYKLVSFSVPGVLTAKGV